MEEEIIPVTEDITENILVEDTDLCYDSDSAVEEEHCQVEDIYKDIDRVAEILFRMKEYLRQTYTPIAQNISLDILCNFIDEHLR